jgi:hypothetical protein
VSSAFLNPTAIATSSSTDNETGELLDRARNVTRPIEMTFPTSRTTVCSPHTYELVGFATSSQGKSLKLTEGVKAGSTLFLNGIAKKISLSSNCLIGDTALPFKWNLYIISQNRTSDITSILVKSSTLSPSFVPKEGEYILVLSAGTKNYVNQFRVFDLSDDRWVSMGPVNVGGHMTAISIDPVTSTLYAGSDTGGVWKSEINHFVTLPSGIKNRIPQIIWKPLSDFSVYREGLPNLKVVSLLLHRNPEPVLFVGIGDGHGMWRYSINNNVWSKSGTDTTRCSNNLLSSSTVMKIVSDSIDSPLVYAGTSVGLFKTTDGGLCWQMVFNTTNNVTDIALFKSSSIYLAVAKMGIYLLDTTGRTAPKLLNNEPGSTLPPSPSGFDQILLAQNKINPDVIYAYFSSAQSYKIFKTSEPGINEARRSWIQIPTPSQNCFQCGYNDVLAIHPKDSDILFVGQGDFWVSIDGGNRWNPLRDYSTSNQQMGPEFGQNMHTDQHALVFDPNVDGIFYVGNDGGIYKFRFDKADTRPFWSSLNHELVTTQFYFMGNAPFDKNLVAGGTQDNCNGLRVTDRTWQLAGNGCDGLQNQFDASSFGSQYITYYNWFTGAVANINRHISGQSQDLDLGVQGIIFASPFKPGSILIIPTTGPTPGQLTHSSNMHYLPSPEWRCADPTPSNPNDAVTSVDFWNMDLQGEQILVGSNDGAIYSGRIGTFLSQGDCNSSSSSIFKKIFPTTLTRVSCLNTASGGVVDIDIKRMPSSLLDSIYATYQGTDKGRILQFEPLPTLNGLMYCGHDITDNLPTGLNVGNLIADKLRQGVLYVGTQSGIFKGVYSNAGTWNWKPAPGIPQTIITSIEDNGLGDIRASTYGRGVFELIRAADVRPVFSPLRSLEKYPVSLLNDSNTMSSINTDKSLLAQCSIIETTDSDKGRVSLINVQYKFPINKSQDVNVNTEILKDGKKIYNFMAENGSLKAGETAVIIPVLNVKTSPLTFSTDQMRANIFDAAGKLINSNVCDIPLDWRAPNSLTLTANVIPESEESFPPLFSIPISILGNQQEIQNTPFEYTFLNGSKLNLSTPQEIQLDNGSWRFKSWIINSNKIENSNIIQFNPTNDTSLMAIYIITEK